MEDNKESLGNINQCKSIYTISKEFLINIYKKLVPIAQEWYTMIIMILGFGVLVIVFLGYYNNHREAISSSEHIVEMLGQAGDFLGGTLNPIFAFLSFCLLLFTIKLQSKELKNSTEELAKSSKALKEQSHSIKLQNFENTFFNMINLHNEIVNNLLLNKIQRVHGDNYNFYTILGNKVNINDTQDFTGKKAISKLFEICNTYIKDDIDKDVERLYYKFNLEYNQILGHYFRNIYQILKFINTQHILKNKNKNKEFKKQKLYINILRAQLSNQELALLFINSLSEEGEKLLPLLIKFEFMEPLPIIKQSSGIVISLTFNNSYLKNLIELYIQKIKDLNQKEHLNYKGEEIFGEKDAWKEYINYINTSSQEQQ